MFNIYVRFGQDSFRYEVTATGGNYMISGSNGSIIVSADGELVEGRIARYYLNIITRTINETINKPIEDRSFNELRNKNKRLGIMMRGLV
jgi:hypothetical protein